jgi:hypothetical protein
VKKNSVAESQRQRRPLVNFSATYGVGHIFSISILEAEIGWTGANSELAEPVLLGLHPGHDGVVLRGCGAILP